MIGIATKETILEMIRNTKCTITDISRSLPIMDLIHYSFVPLILLRVPYALDLLPYYLSIANGGVGIFELLVFHCEVIELIIKVINVLYILMYCYTRSLFVVLREGWVSYTNLFAGNLP